MSSRSGQLIAVGPAASWCSRSAGLLRGRRDRQDRLEVRSWFLARVDDPAAVVASEMCGYCFTGNGGQARKEWVMRRDGDKCLCELRRSIEGSGSTAEKDW